MKSIKYSDGIYFGSTVNGKRDGRGTFIFNDGSRYTGSWVNDLMQGTGYLFDAEGNELHYAVWYEGKIIYEIGDSWNAKPSQESKCDRVALCIGNCAYDREGFGELNNCICDAEVLAGKLQSLGFSTTVIRDARKYSLEDSINEFIKKAKESEIALVFYSGHGISYNGMSFLVPVDDGFYCIDNIINLLDQVNCRIKIAVIDACRSNLEESNSKGLYHTNAKNALVAYATSPNYTASDGMRGTHSPYIRAIMEMLDKPRIPLISFFQEVSALVSDYTNGLQQPFIESSLTNIEFFFNKG